MNKGSELDTDLDMNWIFDTQILNSHDHSHNESHYTKN